MENDKPNYYVGQPQSNIQTTPIQPAPAPIASQQQAPIQAEPQKAHRPHRALALVGGAVVAAALVAGGVYLYVSYQARDDKGRTSRDLQAEVAAMEPAIAELSETESSTFHDTGFSSEYFAAADTVAQAQAEKNEMEDIIDKLSENEANRTIITTGAIWLFAAAALSLACGITIYLRL